MVTEITLKVTVFVIVLIYELADKIVIISLWTWASNALTLVGIPILIFWIGEVIKTYHRKLDLRRSNSLFLSYVEDWFLDITRSYELQLKIVDKFLEETKNYKDAPFSRFKFSAYSAYINLERVKKVKEEELYKAFVLNKRGDSETKSKAFFTLLNGIDYLSILFTTIQNEFAMFSQEEKELSEKVFASYSKLKSLGIDNSEEGRNLFNNADSDLYLKQFVGIIYEGFESVENPTFNNFIDTIDKFTEFTIIYAGNHPENKYAFHSLHLVDQLSKNINDTCKKIEKTNHEFKNNRAKLTGVYDDIKNSLTTLREMESVNIFQLH